MSIKRFCGILAAMLIVAMVWVLVPARDEISNVYQTVSTLKPNEILSDEVASAETAAIQNKAAGDLLHYTPQQGYKDLKRLLYIKTHIRESSPVWLQAESALQLLANLRAQHPNGLKFRNELAIYTRSEEYRKIADFSPIIATYNFRPILEHWKQTYPLTILLAIPFFLCMLVRRGFNPLIELVMPLQFVGAIICWPVGAFFYPTSDPAKQVQRAIRGLSYALSFLISICCANLSKAQNNNCGEARQEQHPALQLDAAAPPLPFGEPPSENALPIQEVQTPGMDCQITPDQPKRPFQVQVNVYGDGHEVQSWLFLNFRNWSIFQQNRRSTDGVSPFSYLGIGPKFQIGKVATNIWVGPQYTYNTGKVDKLIAFFVFAVKQPKWSFSTANKLAFSTNGTSPFADRHVQNIRALPIPSWLSFQGEELHVPAAKKRWQEMEFGPMASIGGMLRLRWQFLKDCYIYPFRDLARGEWDVRIGYAHTFGK